MKRLIATVILISYSALMVKVMVFKDLPLIRVGSLKLNLGGTQSGDANLLPFKSISSYLLGERGLMIGSINLIGNIVLLIPIGFLLPIVSPTMTSKRSFFLAIMAGFAIELQQVVLRVGIFDIDDVILNGVGVMIGYWTFTIAAKMLRAKKSKDRTTGSVVTHNN